ncbi:uncharacterized protein LOC119729731 [Patiria miniata]|uniref:PFL domain-containing protein n=1 Tax=Patiria miniata TaxID=46514 RepID=A0A914A484_PATMI|nr:uncharacterized protein LOC119729731 [Patiria miniata]XP_038058374.1 uncharacterized protein LOC119729731 [Patiria miniata]
MEQRAVKRQKKRHPETRRSLADSAHAKESTYLLAQPGIFFTRPKYGCMVVVNLNDKTETGKTGVFNAIQAVQQKCDLLQGRNGYVVSFDPALWKTWSPNDDIEDRPQGNYMLSSSRKFVNTGGDVSFFLKSDTEDVVPKLFQEVENNLHALASLDVTQTRVYNDRAINGKFRDGVDNPVDKTTVERFILTPQTTTPGSGGGSYFYTQKFRMNFSIFDKMTIRQQENVIGRKVTDEIVIGADSRSHIRRARLAEASIHLKILRGSMPYGRDDTGQEGIYFNAFADHVQLFIDLMQSLVGDDPDFTQDKLISMAQGIEGSFWYTPSLHQLGFTDEPNVGQAPTLDFLPLWDVRSTNDYMFYNWREYLHRMSFGLYAPGDPPTHRVIKLLSVIFSEWSDQWYEKPNTSRIPHLSNYLTAAEKPYLEESAAIRKGMAIKKTLGTLIPKRAYGTNNDLFRIHPNELIVGVMPRFSLGVGKYVMPYSREEEEFPWFMKGLNEGGAMGHIVPDHGIVLAVGLGVLKKQHQMLYARAPREQKDFYQSVILALEGVQEYIDSFANLAEQLAQKEEYTAEEKQNLRRINARLLKLKTGAPSNMLEAVQLLFLMHCSMHLIGNPVAIGRLDVLLSPFYDETTTPEAEAQEILDCLWIKLSERVVINRHFTPDLHDRGSTAVMYAASGNFGQGSAVNQWVQQITVGGYQANDDVTPTTACNKLTLLCLKSSRRIPTNAPCLSLRLHKNMPENILQEATRALLSGGAHPILMHDDRLVPSLMNSGSPDVPVSLAAARNYACDGCYEPMIAGETEFAFGTIVLLNILEMTLNEGTLYADSGSVYLRGLKVSYPSPHSSQIKTFDQLKEIFLKHLRLQTAQFYITILSNYGNLWDICPSPLLSSLIHGCKESGRDLSNGGSNYHALAMMYVSASNTIDSLYAIKKLVFDPDESLTTLPQLLEALKLDWGFEMREPFFDERAGEVREDANAATYKTLRKKALTLPRFGRGNPEVDEIANWLMENVVSIAKDTIHHPPSVLDGIISGIKEKYSLPGRPFGFVVEPGIGTFEGYVPQALGTGASADGRRSRQPFASDLSPSPAPQDKTAQPASVNIYQAMRSFDYDSINIGLSNGSPVDMNVGEDFPEAKLHEFIRHYANRTKPIGSNLITVTCANLETYQKAVDEPERYDLVRVRTGGWSEHYVAMFPAHQEQHQRRVVFTPL